MAHIFHILLFSKAHYVKYIEKQALFTQWYNGYGI